MLLAFYDVLVDSIRGDKDPAAGDVPRFRHDHGEAHIKRRPDRRSLGEIEPYLLAVYSYESPLCAAPRTERSTKRSHQRHIS